MATIDAKRKDPDIPVAWPLRNASGPAQPPNRSSSLSRGPSSKWPRKTPHQAAQSLQLRHSIAQLSRLSVVYIQLDDNVKDKQKIQRHQPEAEPAALPRGAGPIQFTATSATQRPDAHGCQPNRQPTEVALRAIASARQSSRRGMTCQEFTSAAGQHHLCLPSFGRRQPGAREFRKHRLHCPAQRYPQGPALLRRPRLCGLDAVPRSMTRPSGSAASY